MSLRLLATSALVVGLTTACTDTSTPTNTNTNTAAAASPTAPPDEFAVARATFEKNCVLCHQKTGEGGPVKLEDGTRLKVPNLREGHAARVTAVQIRTSSIKQ